MSTEIIKNRLFVGVYLPAELARKLKSEAALEGKTKQDFHRELVESALTARSEAKS